MNWNFGLLQIRILTRVKSSTIFYARLFLSIHIFFTAC